MHGGRAHAGRRRRSLLRRRGLRPLTAEPARRRTGRCLCGEVRFAARGEPNWVAWCHCESCRRAAGTPVTAYAGYPAAMVRFTSTPPARFASSPGVERGFCARGGSSISFAGERWPGEIHLHLGCFEDASDLVPTVEAYTEERLPWVRLGGSV